MSWPWLGGVAEQTFEEEVVAEDQSRVEVANGLVLRAVQQDRATVGAGLQVRGRRQRAEDVRRRRAVAHGIRRDRFEPAQLQQAGGGDRGGGAVPRLAREAGQVEV